MFSRNEEALPSNLYFTSVTHRPVNICVSSVSVQFSKMSIYCCGIILAFFSLVMYFVVRADGMVGAVFLYVPSLGYGTLILISTLGVAVFFTFGGACSLAIYYTLGGTPGLFRRA